MFRGLKSRRDEPLNAHPVCAVEQAIAHTLALPSSAMNSPISKFPKAGTSQTYLAELVTDPFITCAGWLC